MSGATAKSKPTTSKIDEKELARLRRQDYWLQMSRAKLVMDLIFVCALKSVVFVPFSMTLNDACSIHCVQDQARQRTRAGHHWTSVCRA
jgi:hypothetical protein